MNRILASACLLGEAVRYDGRVVAFHDKTLSRWHREGRLVSVCPEVAAGLPVPRPPFEISGGGGIDVLDGIAGVFDADGNDATAEFITGAQAALQLAVQHHVRLAIMKERSPSCGSRLIYDGSFRGRKIPGAGVTAALLRRHGIWVYPETRIAQAAETLARWEAGCPGEPCVDRH